MVPAHAGVVPTCPGCPPTPGGGPRARGGGPTVKWALGQLKRWSPRTRGWSHQRRPHLHRRRVVPAHAGVVPGRPRCRAASRCGPRARGGGPLSRRISPFMVLWSPRTRGWSRWLPSTPVRRTVVPAHAGVVPRCRRRGLCPSRGPRARGGGPFGSAFTADATKWSPRTRGWPPRTRGWSPRTRGWSPRRSHPGRLREVVPAHAGVVPGRPPRTGRALRGPRARGGGPRTIACVRSRPRSLEGRNLRPLLRQVP